MGAVPAVRGDGVSGLQEPTPRLAFARKTDLVLVAVQGAPEVTLVSPATPKQSHVLVSISVVNLCWSCWGSGGNDL